MSEPRATRYTSNARVTGEERAAVAAELKQRYQRGESIRSMATDLGRSYGWVQGLLKEAGVTLRGRGGPTRGAAGAKRARIAAGWEMASAPMAAGRADSEPDARTPATGDTLDQVVVKSTAPLQPVAAATAGGDASSSAAVDSPRKRSGKKKTVPGVAASDDLATRVLDVPRADAQGEAVAPDPDNTSKSAKKHANQKVPAPDVDRQVEEDKVKLGKVKKDKAEKDKKKSGKDKSAVKDESAGNDKSGKKPGGKHRAEQPKAAKATGAGTSEKKKSSKGGKGKKKSK